MHQILEQSFTLCSKRILTTIALVNNAIQRIRTTVCTKATTTKLGCILKQQQNSIAYNTIIFKRAWLQSNIWDFNLKAQFWWKWRHHSRQIRSKKWHGYYWKKQLLSNIFPGFHFEVKKLWIRNPIIIHVRKVGKLIHKIFAPDLKSGEKFEK